MMVLSVGPAVRPQHSAGDDFAAWSLAAMAFLGLAHTFKRGEMIRVGLLIERLQRAPAAGSSRSSRSLIGLRFIGFFAWHAVRLTYDSWRFNDMSQGVLAVPLWIPQLGLRRRARHPAAIAFVDELVHVLARQQAALREGPAEDRRGG